MLARILIFSVAYEPLVGGAELAVRNITDRLFDYDYDLITVRFSRRQPKFEKIGNVSVYRVGFGSRLGRLLYPALAFRTAARLHRKNNYQIVWSIMAAYAGAAGLLFKRHFAKVKFLLTLQEGDSTAHIHRRVRGFRRKWQEIFRKADYIQAISNFLADWAKQEGAMCPVEVVPNGVDLGKFQISNFKFQINSKSQITIITVSRLVPKNGIDILIRAFAVIARGTPRGNPNEIASASDYRSLAMTNRVRLQILGSGPEETNLKKLAAELRIPDRVEFLGNISQEELPKYLSEGDIFVRPSRSEGLGIAFLEAMAAGLPVIATRVGGIPDFLTPPSSPPHEGGKEGRSANGLFTTENPKDLADKIMLLSLNVDLRKRLGENGRKLVEEKFSWDKIAGQMDRIFKFLIALIILIDLNKSQIPI